MKKIFLSAVLTILIVIPFSSYAATFKAGENYYLNPGSEINDNLYAAGGNVSILGTVNGDLFTAGGNVTVSGSINGDMAIAGGTVNLGGGVSGDVRAAGGNVTVLNSIGGEVLITGGQINIMPGSVAVKDIRIVGGNISYAGETKQNLFIDGDTVYINGVVKQDLRVKAREIKLGPSALIQGTFNYFSPKEAVIEEGATVRGVINFNKIELPVRRETEKKLVSLAWIVKSLMILASALVLFYFFKDQTKEIINRPVSGFWREALKGFIILVVAPIAILLSFVTIIGVPFGFVGLFFYLASIVISSIIAVLVFAKLVLKYLFKRENYELNWWVIILSVLILGIITLIPFIGWIFTFIIFLASFGSVMSFVYRKLVHNTSKHI